MNTTCDYIEGEYASGKTGLIWFGATGTTRQFGPNCDVGEIIIFDRPLTGSEKALIEGYLAHKWERADLLPAAHPYKANPPGMARSEEHTSELQSLMSISYAVFCLKKKQ